MRRIIIGWFAVSTLILVSNCAAYRHNQEQVFYGRGIWTLKMFLSAHTRANCNINWNVNDPIFFQNNRENMNGFRARYRDVKVIRVVDGKPTEAAVGLIEYEKWHPSDLTHESIHHLLRQSDWDKSEKSQKWCYEQIIAELVAHVARLQQHQVNMQRMGTMR